MSKPISTVHMYYWIVAAAGSSFGSSWVAAVSALVFYGHSAGFIDGLAAVVLLDYWLSSWISVASHVIFCALQRALVLLSFGHLAAGFQLGSWHLLHFSDGTFSAFRVFFEDGSPETFIVFPAGYHEVFVLSVATRRGSRKNKNNEGGKTNIGEVEQMVTNEETPNVLRKGKAANDVMDSVLLENIVNQGPAQGEISKGTALSLEEEVNTDTQKSVGRDQNSLENRELLCDLNKQCSSIGDSFFVDYNYSPVRDVMIVVDDGRGLIQRTEPPDKGYWSDKGSSLSVNKSKQTLGEDVNGSIEPDVNSLEVYSQEVENENNMGEINLSSSQ
ncbi:unnamed protein product [Ilex paraguariensis]|uniref:Uncharacterized protein n=1 Tax=Ilex paraguariensis TaxID=185542 RepID=A0ABC8RN55_9AQUA